MAKKKQRTIVRRTAAKQQSVRITITTTEQVLKHLKALIPLGVFGNNVADVAERMICTQLLANMKKSTTVLLNPEK